MMMVIMTVTQLHSATAVAKACPPPTSRVTTHTAVDEIRLKVVHAVGLYFMSSCMGTACKPICLALSAGMLLQS